MEFEYELVSENEMLNMNNLCNNIADNFRCSIDINPQFESEIDELYKKTILNFAKTTICMFNLRYMEMFENLAKHPNDDVIEFSDTLLGFINSFFKKLELYIDITNEKDLEELRYILEISLIMMDGVIEDNDVELAYESFFQIERRLKKENLYNPTPILEFEKVVKIITQMHKEIYRSKNESSELILTNYNGDIKYEVPDY